MLVEQKEERMKNVIHYCYNKSEQMLELKFFDDFWIDVLEYQDWSMLCQMRIYNCKVNDQKIKTLLKFQWPNLYQLILTKNSLRASGLYQLFCVKENFMNNLKRLDLGQNIFGNSGAKMLVKSNLPYLEQLLIGNCRIGNEGLKHIIKGRWPQLKCLYFSYDIGKNENKMTIDTWQRINQNNWKILDKFYVFQSQPICFIHCALIQCLTSRVNDKFFNVKNDQIKYTVINILQKRKLIRNY